MHRKLLLLFIPLVMLLAPAAALADSDHVPIGQTALGLSLWALGVGALVPLATYVLNRFVPNEPARAAVLLVVAAIAGALTQLINAGSIGFDTATLRYVLSAVIAALAAHHLLWRPGLVNVALGHPDHGVVPAARHRTTAP
jgi:MFS family permease